MSEHRYDIRISESCDDPNPFKVERQDAYNFTRFQTRERCALEIAAYVFKCVDSLARPNTSLERMCKKPTANLVSIYGRSAKDLASLYTYAQFARAFAKRVKVSIENTLNECGKLS